MDEAKRINRPSVETLRLFRTTMKFATQQTCPPLEGVQGEVPSESVGWTFFNSLLNEALFRSSETAYNAGAIFTGFFAAKLAHRPQSV
ncbi:MAG: hypothetical protein CSYNP_02075 [Syntrophus sp. SKADARSKE-3]|nr:hypothetical protein [Syntrophus sp. SKADARSKE-3]